MDLSTALQIAGQATQNTQAAYDSITNSITETQKNIADLTRCVSIMSAARGTMNVPKPEGNT